MKKEEFTWNIHHITFKMAQKTYFLGFQKEQNTNCIKNVEYFFSGSNHPVAALEALLLIINMSVVRNTTIAAFTPTVSAVYVLLM